MARQLYRRTLELVATSHFRLDAATVLRPGDPIDGLREFHRRSLYNRRLVGAIGDKWTEARLARHADRDDLELARLLAEEAAEKAASSAREAERNAFDESGATERAEDFSGLPGPSEQQADALADAVGAPVEEEPVMTDEDEDGD